MKIIAIPISQGELSSHFGHTEQYAVYTVEDNRIVSEEFAIPPEHQYGSHPRFLQEIGCNVVLTGGMGIKAQSLMTEYGIEVLIGVEQLPPKELVNRYLAGTLTTGSNRCDH